MRRRGFPSSGELVVCRIKKIHPNSVVAELLNYPNKTGMVHVSEVAKRWVKDIREFLKENQHVVCKVMNVDQKKENISLSVKRVYPKDAKRKLNQFKRERKAEKILEMAGEELNADLDQAYEEAGYQLQEEFGSLHKAMEIAYKKPELLKKKGIKKKWAQKLSEIAEKRKSEKEYKVRGELKLKSFHSKGIDVIREVLSEVKGAEVRYISPPKYIITSKGKDYRETEEKVEKEGGRIVKNIQKKGGEGSFKLVED